MIKRSFIISILLYPLVVLAQPAGDSLNADQRFNFHFQNTIISQYHPPFNAKYTGKNSLIPTSEEPISVSTTLFMGMKLWNGASVFFNPELTCGKGFSQSTGVAGFPNGEVYRVDNPAPRAYIARLLLEQIIPLSSEKTAVDDDANQLKGERPLSYISISMGKFSVLDYFDLNSFSHDPRTQFYNWALMGVGAWDYPANTRGYTYGVTTQLVKLSWALRFAVVMVSETANGHVMDRDILKARSHALEFEHKYKLFGQEGNVKLIAFYTLARMGNYNEAIAWGLKKNAPPSVDSVNRRGNTKYGLGLNIEHNLGKSIGFFLRAGWNDGQNETWAFTEIDRSFSTGVVLNGSLWKRSEDRLGVAFLVNGISKFHRDYLKKGGYGFIIGDGNLNYSSEKITEIYYSFRLGGYPLWISPDYQFILDPAYNMDRGPVHALGVRIHAVM